METIKKFSQTANMQLIIISLAFLTIIETSCWATFISNASRLNYTTCNQNQTTLVKGTVRENF